MQSHLVFHKRKSFSKLQPELPIRKKSQNSRQLNRKNHRTQYDTLQSPSLQLKNYKRKKLTLLTQLQSSGSISSNNLRPLKTDLSTDRTNITKLMKSEEQISLHLSRNQNNVSIQSFKNQSQIHKINIKKIQQQPTSRFMYDHHDTDSLALLININKSKDSNPLINTARMDQKAKKTQQQSKNQINLYFKKGNSIQQTNTYEQIKESDNKQSQKDQLKISNSNNNRQTLSQLYSSQNKNQENQNQQENNQPQNQTLQKFDDYIFGGDLGSIPSILTDDKSSIKKKKKSKVMLPPKVQPYTLQLVNRQKPANWRQKNRYQPQTQQQNRMSLQTFNKQKQKLQYFRQQKQITKLLQEYHLNKNAILHNTQRKIESNKILQKIYQDKKRKTQCASLPHLKKNSSSHYSLPKRQIVLPDANQFYEIQNQQNTNIILQDPQQNKIKNLLTKNVQNEKKNKEFNKELKYSVSLNRLGFGTRQPRKLYEQQIKQSQLQNVQKLQRKLRQKGISFNPTALRKSLINVRDLPSYKLTALPSNIQKSETNKNILQVPSKQLPSNQFYKVFPL